MGPKKTDLGIFSLKNYIRPMSAELSVPWAAATTRMPLKFQELPVPP